MNGEGVGEATCMSASRTSAQLLKFDSNILQHSRADGWGGCSVRARACVFGCACVSMCMYVCTIWYARMADERDFDKMVTTFCCNSIILRASRTAYTQHTGTKRKENAK